MQLSRLPRNFYLRPTLIVARELPGMYLCRRLKAKTLVGRIVEVEAYLGSQDPASHAYRGKTRRNEVMFRKGGHLYVYFTYGMHFCANVVTENEGIGTAVLLRAIEPVRGVETMAAYRGLPRELSVEKLCSGPARLCQAFVIGRKENGTDLTGRKIWISRDLNRTPRPVIVRSARIGIRHGRNHRWRFFEKRSRFVSRGKPAPGDG